MTREEANLTLDALREGRDMPEWHIVQCLRATGDLVKRQPGRKPGQKPAPQWLQVGTRVMRIEPRARISEGS